MQEKRGRGAPKGNQNRAKGEHGRNVISLSGQVNDHIVDVLKSIGYQATPREVSRAVELALNEINFYAVHYPLDALASEEELAEMKASTVGRSWKHLRAADAEDTELKADIPYAMADEAKHDMRWIRTCLSIKIDRLIAVVDRLDALSFKSEVDARNFIGDEEPNEREIQENWYARPAWQRSTVAFFRRRWFQAHEILLNEREYERDKWIYQEPVPDTEEEAEVYHEKHRLVVEMHRKGIDIEYREE